MYCRVLACDFDGTGASNGQLAPELAAALSAARARGITTVLVTGRVHEEVQVRCADLSMFDAIVAENGAVICFPGQQRTIQLGKPPPAELLSTLRARGVPFHAGAVIVGTWERHARDLLELVRSHGVDGQIIFNREAVMLLPTGINKATGIERALEELGRSQHNLIAFGDAENDLPLFAIAEVAVAARGSVPTIARQAQESLSQPNGAGVARYIHKVLHEGCRLPTPPDRSLAIGADATGTPVTIPVSGHVLVSGDPRSGKSWLTGLFAERLLERNYRFCLIDPEGDHVALGRRPRTLLLGRDLPLPEPAALLPLIVDHGLSLVLVLSALTARAQRAYVEKAVQVLQDSSDTSGLPHWILVDEAQYFFGGDETYLSLPRLDGGASYLFATYRPSVLSGPVHTAIGAHIIARTVIEEERYFITSLLQARGPREIVPFEALSALEPPRVGLLLQTPSGPRWTIVDPAARVTVHAHHAHKYAEIRVPDDRAFWFGSVPGQQGAVAHNIVQFHAAVETLPPAVLRQHLVAGDFSRWAGDVLGDFELAGAFRKLERTVQHGAAASSKEVLAHIEDSYDLRPPPG